MGSLLNLRLLCLLAGDNTVLLQQVAALLLKKYKDKFDGGAVHASWVYLRQWAVGAMPANPLTSYDTSARHLRDPTFLKRALRCAFSPSFRNSLSARPNAGAISINGDRDTSPDGSHPSVIMPSSKIILAGRFSPCACCHVDASHDLRTGTGLRGCCTLWRDGCASTRRGLAPSMPGAGRAAACLLQHADPSSHTSCHHCKCASGFMSAVTHLKG